MGCTQAKCDECGRQAGVAKATASPGPSSRRVDTLRKIPTRLFAIWSSVGARRDCGHPQMPRPPSVALNLLASPSLLHHLHPPLLNLLDERRGSTFGCLLDPSREGSLGQLDATRERTRNAYEDFGSPPHWTVDAYDRLDFDANPMEVIGQLASVADFY